MSRAWLIGISYKRAWFMAQKIRSAMEERDGDYLLEGVVELDESYFGGKRSGKRGRGAAHLVCARFRAVARDP